MTKFKKFLILIAAVLALGATTITAFATSDYNNFNSEERFQEFKDEMLANKKAVLDQRVKDGILTQKEADEIYGAIKENQAIYSGTGSGLGRGMGIGMGAGFGRMMGNGFGQGRCNGLGYRAFSNSQVN